MPNVLIKDRMLNHCAESELKFKREVIYYLIQEVETLTVPTVCCKIRKSVHSWYCGKYSHLHLAAPAQLDVPVLITTEDCKNMHFTKTFVIEGINIPVFHHRMQSQTFYSDTVTYKR